MFSTTATATCSGRNYFLARPIKILTRSGRDWANYISKANAEDLCQKEGGTLFTPRDEINVTYRASTHLPGFRYAEQENPKYFHNISLSFRTCLLPFFLDIARHAAQVTLISFYTKNLSPYTMTRDGNTFLCAFDVNQQRDIPFFGNGRFGCALNGRDDNQLWSRGYSGLGVVCETGKEEIWSAMKMLQSVFFQYQATSFALLKILASFCTFSARLYRHEILCPAPVFTGEQR